MPSNKEKRALSILYVLAVYVFFQLSWWGYHLVQLNVEIFNLKTDTIGNNSAGSLSSKIWMVVGEGSVFFILLALGFWYIKRTVSKELQLARMEKTFLLSVTHELKTPIASIKLFLETMKSRNLSPEQQNKIVSQAIQETKRLQSLTENILLATRLDQRNGILITDTCNLSDLVTQESERFKSIYNANLELQIQRDVTIEGDYQMLSAMVVNLLENAIKYSAEQSLVKVTLSKEASRITLIVADSGVGIDEKDKQRIFEKFYRAGNEETRTTKGTGLGLYISKNIARLHNADIYVKGNSPKGSIFTVNFETKRKL